MGCPLNMLSDWASSICAFVVAPTWYGIWIRKLQALNIRIKKAFTIEVPLLSYNESSMCLTDLETFGVCEAI